MFSGSHKLTTVWHSLGLYCAVVFVR